MFRYYHKAVAKSLNPSGVRYYKHDREALYPKVLTWVASRRVWRESFAFPLKDFDPSVLWLNEMTEEEVARLILLGEITA